MLELRAKKSYSLCWTKMANNSVGAPMIHSGRTHCFDCHRCAMGLVQTNAFALAA